MFISFRYWHCHTERWLGCLSVQIQVSGFKKKEEKRDVKENSYLKTRFKNPFSFSLTWRRNVQIWIMQFTFLIAFHKPHLNIYTLLSLVLVAFEMWFLNLTFNLDYSYNGTIRVLHKVIFPFEPYREIWPTAAFQMFLLVLHYQPFMWGPQKHLTNRESQFLLGCSIVGWPEITA